jgi:hypothetical protein
MEEEEFVLPTIVRWRVGIAPLATRWTEAIGRMMRADETPADVERRFSEWMGDCIADWESQFERR